MKNSLRHITTIPMVLAMLALSACSGSDEPYNGGATGGEEGANKNANNIVVCAYANRLEFPKLSTNGHSVVVVHRTSDSYDSQGVNFATEWDYNVKSQRWSCYQMHKSNGGWGGSWSRYDYKNDKDGDGRQYPWDADLSDEYYDRIDYYSGSGYDHGHICPAADRSYSFLADKQTFYMTNMQPQRNAFNAGHWAKLETQIRNWASANNVENIYVCKGATIDKNEYILERRNSGKFIVPKYFFCALLVQNSQGYKTIAFWMENEAVDRSNEKLGQWAISVDELERRTGIDFFCNLPDDIEEDRESRCDLTAWGL